MVVAEHRCPVMQMRTGRTSTGTPVCSQWAPSMVGETMRRSVMPISQQVGKRMRMGIARVAAVATDSPRLMPIDFKASLWETACQVASTDIYSFLTGREQPLSGGILNQLVSGPLDPSTDHWVGPGGMGPPGGQGDWAASVHDYNFSTNGPITIGMYFNATLSPATSKALIQSGNNLIRNAGEYKV